MEIFLQTIMEAWSLLLESSVYILLGLLIGGLLRVFLNPASVARHLGRGRFRPIFRAAFWGIPLPLCSCGVLPAAAALKKQGANNGAVTAFLISTPESGVDSISITYALLDPILTVVRPVAAFLTALAAGVSENLFSRQTSTAAEPPDLSCPVDRCCDGVDCPEFEHARHHTFGEKLKAGLKFAADDVWADLAFWFFVGLLCAGFITAIFPEEVISRNLGPGLPSMLLMLAAGIPMYICATASTPIAAALILKGVSPGAALVFLLAGPATNITSLTVLTGILGKRATGIYLTAIAVFCVIFGLATDQVYAYFNISAKAIVGQASEVFPFYIQLAGAIVLMGLSIRPLHVKILTLFGFDKRQAIDGGSKTPAESAEEDCSLPSRCGST